MKKIIETLGVPKIEEIDYMSNQEYSFIQSTEETIKNDNKLKEILLSESESQVTSLTSVNSNIKKIIFEIIYKCFNYNRKKRISIDEMIRQIGYLYDRYIKEKPMKIDSMNVIDKDNLIQLNAPLVKSPSFSNKSNKNLYKTNTYNNSSGSYLIPFLDDNKILNQNYNNNDLNISKEDNDNNNMNISSSSHHQKNYDSFMSGRYSSVIDNNNNEKEDKIQSINNRNNSNKNFSKFCSLSSISSYKNYNKGYFTSVTAADNGNNHNYNYSNISEKFTDVNSYFHNNEDQSMYTPPSTSEFNQKVKEKDSEYEQLQNRKYIFILKFFFYL